MIGVDCGCGSAGSSAGYTNSACGGTPQVRRMFLPMQATQASLCVPIVGRRHRYARSPTPEVTACYMLQYGGAVPTLCDGKGGCVVSRFATFLEDDDCVERLAAQARGDGAWARPPSNCRWVDTHHSHTPWPARSGGTTFGVRVYPRSEGVPRACPPCGETEFEKPAQAHSSAHSEDSQASVVTLEEAPAPRPRPHSSTAPRRTPPPTTSSSHASARPHSAHPNLRVRLPPESPLRRPSLSVTVRAGALSRVWCACSRGRTRP
jgi:hypothetical protein